MGKSCENKTATRILSGPTREYLAANIAADLIALVLELKLCSVHCACKLFSSGTALAAKSVSDQKTFEDFIRRVREGDEQATEELVQLYEPLVRRELRIKMTDRRMSQLFDTVDVCQSIWSSFFVRVAAGQYDLESPQHLAKLLSSMAKNKLASQARRQHALKRDVDRILHQLNSRPEL